MNESNQFIEFEEKVRKAVSSPNARPEFVNQLREDLVKRERKPRPRFILKPAWALAILLIALSLLISSPRVVKAIQQLFGYIPGVGLVESNNNLRILAEPVSLTRDGVTLTIEHVFVYEDHVQLIYDVQGIDPSNDGTQAADAINDPTAFCGGVNIGESSNHDGDALLRLPDGTLLERDRTGLYPQNAFSMKPVFKASIPRNVMEMTFMLKCIPWARLGAVPGNWEVPFELKWVPEGEVVGLPVIEVESTEAESARAVHGTPVKSDSEKEQAYETPETLATAGTPPPVAPTGISVLPSPAIEMRLEKVALSESNMIFYISLEVENPDPSLLAIMPKNLYLIDALGQKINLIPSFQWHPSLHQPGSLFEYVSQTRPADGPLTIILENAVVYFAPMYVEPPQAAPEEMTFTFNVGATPQRGQNWPLDARFEIAGFPFQIVSAQAVVWDDVTDPSNIVGSQGYDYGYQFNIQADPRMKMSVSLDLVSDKCGLWVMKPATPEGSDLLYTSLCREAYPTGEVAAIVRELSVLVEGRWQVTWETSGD